MNSRFSTSHCTVGLSFLLLVFAWFSVAGAEPARVLHAFVPRRRLACSLGWFFLVLVAISAVAAGPKRVLIVHSFGSVAPPFTTHSTAFETELTEKMGERVDLDEISLDMARYADLDMQEALVEYMQKRQAKWQPDLVVPIGSPAGVFVAQYRDRLFPETPIVYCGLDRRRLPPDALQKNATFVGEDFNLPGFVEDILQVAPATTNIAVVIGASPLEQYWTAAFRQEFEPFTNRVSFTWLNDLSFDQMLARVSQLPPRSFIFLILLLRDATGVTHNADEALKRIHEVANAPVNSIFQNQLGLGIVGGRLYQAELEGVESARMAIRILQGEPVSNFPPKIVGPLSPRYDWRELQRWKIGEDHLPPGSTVLFRQPGYWKLYRWPIAGGVSFCLLQAALIIGLLISRAKRRQGEAEATLIAEISSKFVNLPAGEVDREIVDAERRICELLGLDLSTLWQKSDEASGYFKLTHHYSVQEGPQPPERMNEEQFPWCREQMLAGHTVAISSLEELPAKAARDRESARRFGIKSILGLPLSVGGDPPIGVLGLNTLRAERDWPDALVKRLQLLAQIFANALSRKRFEQALRESEERLSLTAASAGAGLWVLDRRTHVFWATEKARVILECSPDEVINMERLGTLVHPEDWNFVQSSFERFVHAVEPVNMEYRIRLGDGRERWIASRGRAHFTSGGEPDRVMGVSIDITERKRAEVAVWDLSGRLIDAQERERARLARKLHDGLSQDLALLIVELELMGQQPPTTAIKIANRMQELSAQMKKLASEVHRISHDLHPAKLTQLGLIAAINELCHAVLSVHQIPVSFEHSRIPHALPTGVALCFYRVAQESLQNVVKHSGARHVGVELRQVENELHLSVVDDGSGFELESNGTNGALGLVSMRERVRSVRGQIRIESKPGEGTRISVRTPLPAAPKL